MSWQLADDKKREALDKRLPGWPMISELVFASLTVDTFEDLLYAFYWLQKCEYMRMLKINDDLENEYKVITITFDFDEKLIGKIELKFGDAPPQYESNKILEQLA